MKNYKILQTHYENCLNQYGPTAKGMDWPDSEDLNSRFKVLTELIVKFEDFNNKTVDLLDLGCGVGLLVDYLERQKQINYINYYGIDISELMVEAAKKRLPKFKFESRDILVNSLLENETDYIIMNGLFTEKREMSHEEMFDFFKQIINQTYKSARKGIAFNIMSTHVEWEREDLFHLGLDKLVDYITNNLTRNIIIRMDYGLYEYAVYLRK